MDHLLPPAARHRPLARTALVTVLHSSGGTGLADDLVRAWAPAVPAAAMSTMLVASGGGGIAETLAQIGRRLGEAGLDASSLVLAGIGGGEETALQLAFGQPALACAGVVACGDSLPPLRVLRGRPEAGRAKLRLVWTADDPLFCAAALGDLLRCLRAAGLDAAGAVLQRQDGPLRQADGRQPSSLPLVRLGGAYLAELVAVALGSTGRLQAHLADIG
jgi:hypothetical protein